MDVFYIRNYSTIKTFEGNEKYPIYNIQRFYTSVNSDLYINTF
jgi:hypothetical protein